MQSFTCVPTVSVRQRRTVVDNNEEEYQTWDDSSELYRYEITFDSRPCFSGELVRRPR